MATRGLWPTDAEADELSIQVGRGEDVGELIAVDRHVRTEGHGGPGVLQIGGSFHDKVRGIGAGVGAGLGPCDAHDAALFLNARKSVEARAVHLRADEEILDAVRNTIVVMVQIHRSGGVVIRLP